MGRSEHVQAEWLKHMQLGFPEDFQLAAMLETAAGETRAHLEQAMRGQHLPPSMQGQGEDVADLLNVCRYGLELSKADLLGTDHGEWAAAVGASLQARTVAAFTAGHTAKINYGEHVYEVRLLFDRRVPMHVLLHVDVGACSEWLRHYHAVCVVTCILPAFRTGTWVAGDSTGHACDFQVS